MVRKYLLFLFMTTAVAWSASVLAHSNYKPWGKHQAPKYEAYRGNHYFTDRHAYQARPFRSMHRHRWNRHNHHAKPSRPPHRYRWGRHGHHVRPFRPFKRHWRNHHQGRGSHGHWGITIRYYD